MENTTRIVDLPENISIQMPSNMGNNMPSTMSSGGGRSKFEESATNYTPINIHPNPYGNDIQTSQMPLPEFQQMNRSSDSMNIDDYIPKEQRRLPSRDIPMDQTIYQNDEEIQPNYIPRPKLTGDYIKEYEVASKNKIQKHEKNKQSNEEFDDAMTDYQIPLFVALLFFLFNIPIINILLFKYLKMLPVFHSDGNLKFYGILMKSSLFGIIFWIIQRAIKFLMVV
jgi:hypothetical protein